MLAEYRRCWRDPAMIHASCCDYRAGASIDLAHDEADLGTRLACPTLALWGANGLMHTLMDIEAAWRARCADLRVGTVPGGHWIPGAGGARNGAGLAFVLREPGSLSLGARRFFPSFFRITHDATF